MCESQIIVRNLGINFSYKYRFLFTDRAELTYTEVKARNIGYETIMTNYYIKPNIISINTGEVTKSYLKKQNNDLISKQKTTVYINTS